MRKISFLYRSYSIIVLIGLFCGLQTTLAADLDRPTPPIFSDNRAPPPQAEEDNTEFGSGWYLRGDAGYFRATQKNAAYGCCTVNNTKASSNVDFGFGGGYRFNSWLRADATVDLINKANISGANVFSACPGTFSGCTITHSGQYGSSVGLINAYLDLPTPYGIRPYVGGGVGVTSNTMYAMSHSYTNNDTGGTYLVQTCCQTYSPNYTSAKYSKYNFAWSLAAGLAFNIGNHTELDIGYRYLNLGSFNTPSANGVAFNTKINEHQVRIGLRYMID